MSLKGFGKAIARVGVILMFPS
ncbi:unnamed protein product [Kuraishia capsulata CBS 1993]|uniref:Uncharacterized protein n=1 Tax=Kuraishia capsulata CBS 1993 TaxID=1382522 RepID=W6MS96_9ASCO|nr:unnamed protein product [Kuraishia capsulata CBS 1993]